MGLISPIIVQMKILLQDICKADHHWDAELDLELKTRWMKLISELGQVKVNKTRSSKPVSPVGSGSLTSEEVLFSESLWILESQKSLPLNRNFIQQCAQLGVIKD